MEDTTFQDKANLQKTMQLMEDMSSTWTMCKVI